MRPKILLLDDDKDLLVLYKDILSQLPSRPEIMTCSKGARAITILEEEPFNMLISDLSMPRMDGLQVLSIVRRRFPQIRTVVLTSMLDEQFRSRAYSLGVDLFWHKPSNSEETQQFLDCIESLLGRDDDNEGFRGVQSKSLLDIVQLECLCQNSTVLKITHGPYTGRVWVGNGEVLDAETPSAIGEEAFRQIFSWKSGNFETLGGEPDRPRRIFTPYQSLLLQSAQAEDESKSLESKAQSVDLPNHLSPIIRNEGVEFVLSIKPGDASRFEARGLENPEPAARWCSETLERFRALGDRLQAGPLMEIVGVSEEGPVTLTPHGGMDFLLGWDKETQSNEVSECTRKALSLWIS